MTRSVKTEGIVIKRKNYGEADKILTIFTKDQGKISVKATGVRRITSKRSPHVELLNHVNITLYKGMKFPVLSEAQTIDDFAPIKADLKKVGYAYHICELIDGLCPENQEQQHIFELLKDMLTELSCGEDDGRNLEEFEIALLTALGFWNQETQAANVDVHSYIEDILERRLKSKKMFGKLH